MVLPVNIATPTSNPICKATRETFLFTRGKGKEYDTFGFMYLCAVVDVHSRYVVVHQ